MSVDALLLCYTTLGASCNGTTHQLVHCFHAIATKAFSYRKMRTNPCIAFIYERDNDPYIVKINESVHWFNAITKLIGPFSERSIPPCVALVPQGIKEIKPT